MKQINFKFRVVLSLLLVFFCSSLWGAKNSTYKIVNNSGEVVFHVKGTTDNPQLPAKAQSPFATNYRYYRYLEDAKLDASSGAEAAASKRLTGNLSYNGDVFVRYDYNPETNVTDQKGNILRIDGKVAYNFTICNYAGGTDKSKNKPVVGTPGGRYVYYNSSSTIQHSSLSSGIYEKVHIKPYNTDNNTVTDTATNAEKETAAFQWRFIGQLNGYEGAKGKPDPYDIVIKNVSDNVKVLTGIYNRNYNDGPTTQQYIHLTLLAPDDDATHVQRFFIRKLSNTVQIAACAPLYLYLGGTTQKDMWFVLNKEPNEYLWTADANSFKEEDCFQTLHMRIHAKQEDAKNIDNGSEKRSTILFYRKPTRKYIILDAQGNKVAAANAEVERNDVLEVPASIASAFPGTSYSFYKNQNKTESVSSLTAGDGINTIYVTYAFNEGTAGNQVKLDGTKSYIMKLNGSYVKFQANSGQDSDVNVGTEEESDGDEFVWTFTSNNNDPYHMELKTGTGTNYITGESTGSTIALHTGNKAAALKSDRTIAGRTPSTFFLVKSPAYTAEKPVYLLRASYVGEVNDVDRPDTLYTWAYGNNASDWNEARPRLYSSTAIEDFDDAVQMELEEIRDGVVTYHIVDKTHTEVIDAKTRRTDLDVPLSISSPLVSKYYYYSSLADAQTDARGAELLSAIGENTNIYVTYDVGTDIKINVDDTGGGDGVNNDRYKDKGNQSDVVRNNGTFYMLKFHNGESYYHEDGNNGITKVTKQAEVPYSNGDACMNIYDQEFADGTLAKGGSARTRIPWALIGGDPYRLKISAYQNSHKLKKVTTPSTIADYKWYFSYFRTYYNTTLGKVITTNVTDDPLVTTDEQYGDANAVPTEYMILGTKGNYKLVTTEKINDGATEEHRTVNSFEQYWKNNETIGGTLGTYTEVTVDGKKKKIISSMPSDSELRARGWNKYAAWANATPLDGRESKSYEYQNHWFQTFEMGEEFDLIEVSLNPSIVLLDNHGWEIFRHPMPTSKTSTDKKETVKTRFIKTYDSPMVKAYHWYRKVEKVSGMHKYVPYDPAYTESGDDEFTSTTLTDYPPEYEKNPGDWYVTYEVKDDYAYLYDYNGETPISAPCLIGNANKWATASSNSIGNSDSPTVTVNSPYLSVDGNVETNQLWYLKPNPDIDKEMGMGENGTYSASQKGFDPYNIMIQNGSQYFQNGASSADFNEQEWSSATDTSISLGSAAAIYKATGAEGVEVYPTNFTFMSLMDAHGNMRLVPRFDHLSAITNLGSSPTMAPWIWDTQDSTTVIVDTDAMKTSIATQAIKIQPIQKYKFEVRAASGGNPVASSSEAFYAAPGASIYTKLGDVSVPLPRNLIRSYCEYPAAYTNYDISNNTYANEVTCYPPGRGSGISSDGVPIYVPYYPKADLFSAAQDTVWYNISFENKSQFIKANASDHTVAGGGDQIANTGKWAFFGSPYNLQIVNKAEQWAGNTNYYLAMNADGNGTLMTNAVDERNHWTLVYNDNGNPIMRLTTQIDSNDAYIKKSGVATKETTYPNGNEYKIFLSNLITVYYHVYRKNGNTWEEEYKDSVDYDSSQLADYAGLPASVSRPLCSYKFFREVAGLEAQKIKGVDEGATDGYTTFSTLYTDLTDTQKVSNMHIYLSYDIQYSDSTSPVRFFATEAEARASKEWSFLMQGVESAAVVYGKKNNDYGNENARLGKAARTYGEDIAGLTAAEQTFTQHTDIPVLGGFHFIRRTSIMNVNSSTGAMTVPAGTDSVGLYCGKRYIPSQDAEVEAYMMSPLNDFRRIAETYKDGTDTGFRENSWLWAFIGTPYKFEIINREALVGATYDGSNMPPASGGTYKRLAVAKTSGGMPYVRLVENYTAQENGKDKYPHYWSLEQLDTYGDEESNFSFHIKLLDEDKILSRVSSTSMDMRTINTPSTSDIAYLKSTAFMAYPWNWKDDNYKTVTVNIYKDSVSGTPVLTKTFTPADRAFKAGDVIDGTSGHFYLPLEGKADGSWKEKGVINSTIPYDGHKINIPYEIRRRACLYTVENDSFTVDSTDAAQTVNIYYTVPPQPYAPLFVAESELSTFRGLGDNETFHGVKKSDYYYFVDLKNDLSQHAYVDNKLKGASSDTRFAASTPDHAKFFIVGDPYGVRLFNAYTDKSGGSAKNLARNDDGTTSMSETAFYWEVVDASSEGSHGYDASSSNVNYRLDYLGGNGSKALALRTKSDGDATKYYFGKDGKTYATSIYNNGTPQLNKLAAYRDYPDSRHFANTAEVTVSVLRPVNIELSVYDQDEPSKLVTKKEQSDYYALTERFKGIPTNLQRNHCKYTWVSTDSKPSGSNNKLTEDGYFVIDDDIVSGRDLNIYAKYQETDDSPFCTLDENGNPVLKKDPNKSPWYNMSIGSRWAFFNSSGEGKRYAISDSTAFNNTYANKPNNSELTFPYAGSALPTTKGNKDDRFRKGLHWALVGDPYNFQIRCQRDIIELTGEGDARVPAINAAGDFIYENAYIKGAAVDNTTGGVVPCMDTQANATWWTWLRERSSNRYFLSESLTRRTEVAATSTAAKKYGPRRLPINYPTDPAANPPSGTLNFKIGDETQTIAKNQGVINYEAGSYGIGDQMRLLSVDDVDANNDCFDAVVTVYNKVNEPVATTGWTEYARENAAWNGQIDADVMRWGCTYHYWADETMTRYPFKKFNQKDENGNYLVKDKSTIYVTYDYDESLYSSETEYRWLDIFYNWDKTTTDGNNSYTETKEGWIYSPSADNTDKAMCDQISQSDNKEQKWVMIGDPYKFILYNFNRKTDAGGNNSYYLYNDGTDIVNHNFDGTFSPSKEKQPGIYFTWKVDGTSYEFKNSEGTTYKPANMPDSFFGFNGAGANEVQKGYLAICDIEKTSLTDASRLLGSIKGYTTFDDAAATDADKYMKKTESAAKRYLVMPLQQKAATVTFHLDPTGHTDSKRVWTTNPVFDYTTTDFGVDNTISLPWMMRRQYCAYKYYLIPDAGGRTPDNADYSMSAPSENDYVDALLYDDQTPSPSNAHKVNDRNDNYKTFWHEGATNMTELSSMEIPDSWNGKHVYIRVTYQPTEDFLNLNSTSNDGSIGENKTVRWLNIQNQDNGNMLQYMRSQKVIGNSRENGADATNDYLWAIEGDPYGFVLHNRYAVHGFNGTQNEKWSTVMTTDKVNSTENYSYSETGNANFTFDSDGEPVKKSAITYGAKGTADAFGTMSTTTTNAVYEAMTGNYAGAMLIHPVNACINIRNQNGNKYYGAFLFNGAPTNYPVQLNYLQEWEAMRNVYANWRLEKPSVAQLLPYYTRAGFVGGLKTTVVAPSSDNAAIFDKIKNNQTLTDAEYNTAWALVQDPDNIVQLTNGYYRLRAYSSFDNGQYTQDQLGGHYVSGYLHKLEQTQDGGTPLHIYSKAGTAMKYAALSDLIGNSWADNVTNSNLLDIPATEFDPSSIFRITRDENGYIKMETQGLVVSDNIMMAEADSVADNMKFQMQDIGQTAFQMRTKASATEETPTESTFLSCNPNEMKYGLNATGLELNVYEGAHEARIHDTKWLLEPVGPESTNAAGTQFRRPLKLKVSQVGDYYYSTMYLPFNVKVPAGVTASVGKTSDIKPVAGGHYSGTLTMEDVGENTEIKAATPTLIKTATCEEDGSIEITIPNVAPVNETPNPVLSGTYLTQELEATNSTKFVMVFGKSKGVPGFYRNSSKDYDGQTNNLFVGHNKLYFVLTEEQASHLSKGLPITFDIYDDTATDIDKVDTDNGNKPDDDTVYDLLGRKVEHINQPGIYIRNGKKFVVK